MKGRGILDEEEKSVRRHKHLSRTLHTIKLLVALVLLVFTILCLSSRSVNSYYEPLYQIMTATRMEVVKLPVSNMTESGKKEGQIVVRKKTDYHLKEDNAKIQTAIAVSSQNQTMLSMVPVDDKGHREEKEKLKEKEMNTIVDKVDVQSLSDVASSGLVSSLPEIKPIETSEEAIKKNLAVSSVESRREAYKEANRTEAWSLRGNGYLYQKLQIVLEAFLPEPIEPGNTIVIIRNVYDPFNIRRDCAKLTIWVRVNGPEIFAGSATVVQPDDDSLSCFWEFSFDLQIAGTYHTDAKVLLWNGLAPIIANTTKSPCLTFQSNITDSIEKAHPIHSGFLGFKMYHPALMCCEICSRMAPDCTYWSTPPSHPNEKFSVQRNGCELYYDKDVTPLVSHILQPLPTRNETAPQRRRLTPLKKEHGFPYTSQDTALFLGCGWSYHFTLDFPCLSGYFDDRVFMEKETFLLEVLVKPEATIRESLPFCRLKNEHVDKQNGRWVRAAWPNATTCSHSMEVGSNEGFKITEFDGKNPTCWNRDDLSMNGDRCLEMNCGLIQSSSRWISELHREKRWYGMWRQYDCDYLEFSNEKLQQCIDNRNISSFITKGASIASFLKKYLDMRLKGVSMVKERPDSVTVTLDTLGLFHLVHLPDGGFEKQMKALPSIDNRTDEHYVVSGFYLSSEREVYAHVAKVQQLNRIASEVLGYKGYKTINAFDMTAAFTFDTATQFDGMHIIGPPMKAVIAKLLHYVCMDDIDGSRI